MQHQRRSIDERNALIEHYKTSGLSVQAFAMQVGLRPTTLYSWLARVRPANTNLIRMARVIRRPPIQNTKTTTTAHHSPITIKVGTTILRVNTGFDPETLNTLINLIEQRKA